MNRYFSVRRALVGALLLPAALAFAAPSTAQLPGFRTLAGQELSAESMRGKVTVVALFSVTCPFCMNEAPKLEKLYRDNRAVLDVVAVNVDGDASRAAVQAWVRKYGLTHAVTLDYPRFAQVLGKAKGIPALYVFDRGGRLVRSEVGEMLDEDFDDIGRYARTMQ